MRLILVRPGESDKRHSLAQTSEQAECIAREIESVVSRTLPVEAIYTSTNAIATARVLSDRLGLASPIRKHAFDAQIVDTPEYMESLQSKAWSAVEFLLERYSTDCTIVLVAAELPIRLLVCRALSIPVEAMHNFRIDPASLTTLDFRLQPQRRTILAGLNETCHPGSNR